MTRFWENSSGHAQDCPHLREMFRLLSANPTLEVLLKLANSEMNVSEMADALELDASVVSRSLKHLHFYGMVEVKRVGKEHFYGIGRGIKVALKGDMLLVKMKTADGGKFSMTLPRRRV